jgi:hypothetical protein
VHPRRTPAHDDPSIRTYLQRLAARPAFQHAMAKADPGYALQLT